MITNDRQYKIARTKADEFHQALESYDLSAVIASGVAPVFAEAHRNAVASELDLLKQQISEYERLKSGAVKSFEARSLKDLPLILVRARIARNMTQKQLADCLGMKEQQIQRYEANSYRGVSFDRLVQIAEALNVSFSERAEIGRTRTLQASDFPFNEMFKRGWFEDFSGSIRDAKRHANELISTFFQQSGLMEPAFALHRKAVGVSDIDEFALFAWQARVLSRAQSQGIQKLSKDSLSTEWVQDLVRLSAREDGPTLAAEYLMHYGIHFVIEPHLPRTRLDGAAMLAHDGAPLIAMTLRHDRLDNFWFTLLHEIGHIKNHIVTGKIDVVFDDTESTSENDIELEADNFAGEALISVPSWQKCISRFSQTPRSITLDAAKLRISPAIIAGRIRRERRDYTILTDLVGHGGVRRILSDFAENGGGHV